MENKIETPQAILDKFVTGESVVTREMLLKVIEYAQVNTARNMGLTVFSDKWTTNQQKAIDAFTKVVGGGVPTGDGSSYLFAIASMTCFVAGRAFQQSAEKAPKKDEDDLFKAIEKIDEGNYGSAKNFIERYINVAPGLPNTLRPRPAVLWFAEQMEKKLKENDYKGGWANMSFDDLYLMMKKEMQELLATGMKKKSPEAIIAECSDVANFAMMVADLQANNFGK